MSSSDKTVRVLKADTETLLRSKDEEYAYWQSRPPLERLVTMQELSSAFFEEPAMKLKLGADFRDPLRSFHTCGVKYLIIGGWAVSIHAQPRATQDMYIFVGSEKTNLEAVYEALLRCGAPPERVDRQQFLTPGSYYRIGVPPGQVDIFSRIPGVQFEACWPARVEVRLDDEDALL